MMKGKVSEGLKTENCHTSNFSKYVDYHLQRIVEETPSCVKDTKDSIRNLS